MKSELDMAVTNDGNRGRFHSQKRFLKLLLGRKVILFAFIVVMLCIIVAIFAPYIAPHNPMAQDLSHSLENPSKQFLLGTDLYGRDLQSRLIYGTRISLAVSFVSVGIGGMIGTILGTVSGYFGGWIDAIIMRIIDAFLAIPTLIIALVVAVVLGQGLFNVMMAIAISMVPGFARLVRSVALSVKQNDYILANRLIGASHWRTMFFHVLPNAMPQLIVHITIHMGLAILAEASLSFLGLGISSNEIAWGTMVAVGYPYLTLRPLLSLLPGFLVVFLALSWNLAGDGLRDALDPRLRGTL